MKKRVYVYLYIFIISAVVFTGCKFQQIKNAEVKNDKLSGKLVVFCDKKNEESMKVLGESFKAVHDSVDIEIKVSSNFRVDLNNKLDSKAYIGDVFLYEEAYVPSLIDKYSNSFLDLNDEVNYAKYFLPKNKIETSTKKDKNFGMPFSTNPRFLIYKTDDLNNLKMNINDIKTWNDFIELGKNVANVTKKAPLVNVGEREDLFLVLLIQLRTTYVDKDNKLIFTTPKGVKAYEKLSQLYNEKIVTNVANEGELVDLIKKQSVFSALVDYKTAKYIEEKYPEGKDKWTVSKLPAFEQGGNSFVSMGGTQLMLSKDCKNVKLAKAFTSFAVSKGTQLELSNKSDMFPVNTELYSCLEFDKRDEYFSNNRICCLGAAIEKNTYPIVFNKNFENIKTNTRINMNNLKDKDSKTVLEHIDNECSKIILDISKASSE